MSLLLAQAILSNSKNLPLKLLPLMCLQIEFPYLPEDSYRAKKSLFIDSPNSVNLYELVTPPNYQNLFIIGILELP
jgi:hypothetical protein